MRSKTRLLIIFGVILAVLPYLGFPIMWKRFLTTLLALGVIGITVLLRHNFKELHTKLRALDDHAQPTI